MEQIGPKSFSVRDLCLPSLLAEAAIDVDNRIKGRADERESIKGLREILYKWQEQGVLKGFEEYVLFGEAIGIGNLASTNCSEVPLRVNLLLKELDSYKELPVQRLEILRDFCVDLYRRFGNYQTDFYIKRGHVAFA